jgi:hypothetical protein
MVVISQPDHLPETLFILGGGKGVVKPMEEGCGRGMLRASRRSKMGTLGDLGPGDGF